MSGRALISSYLVVFENSKDENVGQKFERYSYVDSSKKLKTIKEALELHIEGLKEQGMIVPEPGSFEAELIRI